MMASVVVVFLGKEIIAVIVSFSGLVSWTVYTDHGSYIIAEGTHEVL